MTRVIVLGAGIGGLATAIALDAAGIDYKVFERAPELGKLEVGAGVTVWNNAVKVLDKLGVGAEIRAASDPLDGFEQRTRRDRRLTRWPMREMAERLGTPAVGISRPALHSVLAAAGSANVQTSSKAVGFEQSDDGVTVSFDDGRTESGGVLIAADGINSIARASLLGDEPPRYTGLTMWRTIIEIDDADKPDVAFLIFHGRGKRFICFGAGPGRMSFEAVVAAEQGGSDADGDRKSTVQEHFRDFCDPVPALIDRSEDAKINRVDIVDRPPDERWGTGRVTLLGDAAHPMTFAIGQGAAQALEDSVAVAAALRDGGGDDVAALRAYEEKRRERAAGFQTMAWKLARTIRWSSLPAVMARNAFFQASARIGAKETEKDMVLEL